MFEKIIEKIKAEKEKYKSDRDYKFISYLLKDIIELIQEEEKENNKPFNPLEIGFTIESSKFGETRYKFKDISINDFQLLHDASGDNYSLFSDGIPDHFNFIKIANHSFGIELLKSTGCFDEGELN